MGNCGSSIFFKLYPSIKKSDKGIEEAAWLRKMCIVATFVHFSLSIMSLALVGFTPMIFNFLQTCWIYSCYLTLREREVMFYLFILLVQSAYCICRILGVGDDPSSESGAFQSLGNIIILCFLVLMGYLIGKAEWDFHKRGGLKALPIEIPDPELVDQEADDEYKPAK